MFTDNEETSKKYIYNGKNLLTVIRDSICFIILALIFGFILEMLIPNVKKTESHFVSFLYIILQLILTIVIVYLILIVYERITGNDAYDFLGTITFLIVFVILQNQVVMRTKYLYHFFSGGTLYEDPPKGMDPTTILDYYKRK